MIFESMQTISLLTGLISILLIWICSIKNPLSSISSLVRELLTSRKFLILFLFMIGVLLINKYELSWEESMDYTADFTSWVFQLEGHFVQAFQNLFHTPWITGVTSFFYLVVFQALIIASLGIYAGDRRKVFLYATCFTVIINYLIAIPFYLFFPVNEVWSYPPAGVSFIMLDAFPNFNIIYRPLSGINNCFPSLHTSISVSMAILAVRSGNRRWATFAVLSAFIIVFSIFYLGIHWLTDMVGGIALATFASWLGINLAKRIHKTDTYKLPKISRM
ncbi:phosphatase PAP2 family protein [Paenibacillus segetis]|uniref:Inositolphosphotransferase Aur1/Ipt1 domain-containing protein n=1 Tax=Paenibacillus segetis TaxID=1325360 RepID=A0ABQ1YM35_9BACL|nr:phosphatase PAP2 family protein [Paenibacillus segetis]GGH29616.1 hypothetical protein GCM10008013_32310 [Paenibacillus segetis]